MEENQPGEEGGGKKFLVSRREGQSHFIKALQRAGKTGNFGDVVRRKPERLGRWLNGQECYPWMRTGVWLPASLLKARHGHMHAYYPSTTGEKETEDHWRPSRCQLQVQLETFVNGDYACFSWPSRAK